MDMGRKRNSLLLFPNIDGTDKPPFSFMSDVPFIQLLLAATLLSAPFEAFVKS